MHDRACKIITTLLYNIIKGKGMGILVFKCLLTLPQAFCQIILYKFSLNYFNYKNLSW